MAADDDLSVRLRPSLHRPREDGWLFIPMSVGQDCVLEMLPNPFTPRSTISRRAWEDLAQRGLIHSKEPPFVLSDLRIVGQAIPDVSVRIGVAANLLRLNGILGYDFFRQYRRINNDTETRWLTLTRR